MLLHFRMLKVCFKELKTTSFLDGKLFPIFIFASVF